MRIVASWDQTALRIARTIADARSKDPSRQVGCVLIHPDSHTIASSGYNGMVAGAPESDAMWERPTKYAFVCHAEFNAIALAAKKGHSVDGTTAYITCMPCLACARLLIQAGIKRIVIPHYEVASGYAEEFEQTCELLNVCDIPLDYKKEE